MLFWQMSLMYISSFWKISNVNNKAEIMRTFKADICVDRPNTVYNNEPYTTKYTVS